jgi:hypothetical protein
MAFLWAEHARPVLSGGATGGGLAPGAGPLLVSNESFWASAWVFKAVDFQFRATELCSCMPKQAVGKVKTTARVFS